MMSQYLPWVLVPRGTYIYHYFATVPFLILSVAILQDFVQKTSRSAGRILACLLLSAAVACMVIFYPYASGMPVSYSWLDIGSRFLRVYYARTY